MIFKGDNSIGNISLDELSAVSDRFDIFGKLNIDRLAEVYRKLLISAML